ncbi:IS3 family transposase [Methylibium sp.]|uniref:IS3 family transposase n=1 Tax=Methylibium sp. TaxID=2067992 RepID=UPI0025EA6FB5|nr:IS3 family transposase [Methylibium sp.]
MSRAGEVWDNSAMESFFRKPEDRAHGPQSLSVTRAGRSDVFDYIERFYNPTRRHSTLGYVSPIEFEKAQNGLSPAS